MSDNEYEKFEITDYDLENEFNPNRPRRKFTKKQQIYGVFNDSDEEDERPSFKSSKAPKNYSAPIGFVAGGVQQAGKKPLKEEKDDEEDGESIANENSSDSESDVKPLRRGFGAQKTTSQSTVTEIAGDIAGLRKANSGTNTTLMRKGIGNWEKHTKGFGAKLLLKMGYQPGKGLGKDLQGIQAPVEAHLRKGRGAIGAYGPEKAASLAKIKESGKDEFDDDVEVKGESKWKKNDVKKKNRYYYRTVDDVIEKGKRPGFLNGGPTSELSKVKVIDMTGPQQRVLSGYHALSGLKAPPGVEHFEDVVHKKCSNFALPEIQHNLDLLVSICEQDIISTDRSTRYCQDREVTLKQEEITVTKVLEEENIEIESLSSILEQVKKLIDPTQVLSLGQFAHIFTELQETYPNDYHVYRLSELAPGLVGPLITSALASWSPLSAPRQYVDVFLQWKDILEKPQQRGTIEGNCMGIQPYDSLVWHTWVPVLRSCVSTWNVRHANDPLITLLETWKPALPHWILENVLDQLIMPRLGAEVNNWNPVMDTLPIHYWIHPWIPMLDSRLKTSIYPIIMEKIGSALTNWHPTDSSALSTLTPWKEALPSGSFTVFILKHIVPKLQLCMESLVIAPHKQHLESWNAIMAWKDMLSVVNLALILQQYFFPRWLKTLAMWLNNKPDYNEITEWYSGWKRLIPKEVLMQPSIKDNFNQALEMMNSAVNTESQPQPGARESVSYLTNIETNAPPPPPPSTEMLPDIIHRSYQKHRGVKEIIGRHCERNGILFAPINNKFYEGKQVYRVGSNGIQVYFDQHVIFYSQNNSSWLPISKDRILDKVA